MNVSANIQRFLKDVQPQERYASFDYCYNYFQSFRENNAVSALALPENMQQSCLQIGFYLASWGMLRGSTFLLWKSIKFYEPLISYIASTDPTLWDIDADKYTDENVERLVQCDRQIVKALSEGGYATGTLVTKIMLGIFGNVPAFDSRFVKGTGIRWYGGKSREAFRQVGEFYEANKIVIDQFQIATIDFATSENTHRLYSKAKLIDMAGFVQGGPSAQFSTISENYSS